MERPPTPVFLPEFHGQRSLMGYSSWDHKESDRTERLTLSLSLSFLIALRAWNPGRCGVGENRLSQRCPRIGAEDGVWYLCFESQHWKSAVPSGLHELSGKTGKGWDWKRIGSRDLQTLQGEGGAKRRLCQPSSLHPHSAQGCVFGLYLFSR